MGLAAYTLTDSYDKSARFVCGSRKKDQAFYARPQWRDRGYGDGHTDAVDFEFTDGTGYTASGDMWRFFEGTLGLSCLHHVANRSNGVDFFLEFAEAFQSSGSDDKAKIIWDTMLSELEWTAEDLAQMSFYVGALSRNRLEDLAADLDVDFTKHTSSDQLRADILEAAQDKGVLFQ